MSEFFCKTIIGCLLGTLKQESWGIQVQQTTQQVFSSSAPEDDTCNVRRKISTILTILSYLDYRWRWRGAQDELAWWGAHGRPHHGGVETGFQVNFKWTWTHKVNTKLHWTKFWHRGQSSGGHYYPKTKVAIIFWLLTCFRCIPPIRSCQKLAVLSRLPPIYFLYCPN